jgi:hypothetical protein
MRSKRAVASAALLYVALSSSSRLRQQGGEVAGEGAGELEGGRGLGGEDGGVRVR